jgi:GNAT superfamily N-acetyltransferase
MVFIHDTKIAVKRRPEIPFHRPPSDLEFRLAGPSDLAALARLRIEHAGCDRSETSRDRTEFCDSFKEFLLSRITTGEWLVLVAESDGQLAGCVYLQKIAKLPRRGRLNRKYGCVTELFVQKQYRGQGLRGKLLREIAQVAQSEGLEYLVGRPKAESLSVYRLLGFRQIASQMELSLVAKENRGHHRLDA